MTELLPGPEDAGKHLFEISPGRRAYLSALRGLALVASGPGGQTSFRMLLPVGTSALSPSMTQKLGPNLENIANLGEY